MVVHPVGSFSGQSQCSHPQALQSLFFTRVLVLSLVFCIYTWPLMQGLLMALAP